MYEINEAEAPLLPLPLEPEFVPPAAEPVIAADAQVDAQVLPQASAEAPAQATTDLEKSALHDAPPETAQPVILAKAEVPKAAETPVPDAPLPAPEPVPVASAAPQAAGPLDGVKQLADIAGNQLKGTVDAAKAIGSNLATETVNFAATVSDGKNWQKAWSEVTQNPGKALTETTAGILNNGYNIVGGLTTLAVGGGGSLIQEVGKLPENATNAVRIVTNNSQDVSQVAPTTAFSNVSKTVASGHDALSNVAGHVIDNGSKTAIERHKGNEKAATSSMYDVGGTITNVGTIVAPMIKGAMVAKASAATTGTAATATTGTAATATTTVAAETVTTAAAQSGNALQKAGQFLSNGAQTTKAAYGAVKSGLGVIDDGLKFNPTKLTEIAGEVAKKAGPLQTPLEVAGKAVQSVTGAIMDPAGSMQTLAVGAFNIRNQVAEALSYTVKTGADDAFGKLTEALPGPVFTNTVMAESSVRHAACAVAEAASFTADKLGNLASRVASPIQSLAQKPVTAFADKFPETAAKMGATASAAPGVVRDALISVTSGVFGVAQDLATLGSRSLGYLNGVALGDMAMNGGPVVTVNNEHTRKVNNMHESSSNVTISAPNVPIGVALSGDTSLINRMPFVPGLNEAQGNAMPRTDVRYDGSDPYRARQITTGSVRPFGELTLSYMAGSKEIGFVSTTTLSPHEALYNFAAVEFDKKLKPESDALSASGYLGNTILKVSGSNRFNLGPLAVLVPRMSATTPLAEVTNDKGQPPLVLGGPDSIGRGPAITLNPSSGFLNPQTRGADWTPAKAFAETFQPIPTTTYTPSKN